MKRKGLIMSSADKRRINGGNGGNVAEIHLGFEWVNEDIIGSKWGQMAHCWLKEVVIESEY